MNPEAKKIQRVYLSLMLGNTLAASLIWGVNTLFLLNAGLNNFEAFLVNAFFSLGMLLFEIPTGIIADMWGRRISYLLGTVTLAITTLAYYVMWHVKAPVWQWAVVSMLLGLGFTFFTGATDAWLVDALHYVKFDGKLEAVFGKAQMVAGGAMLVGSVAGGVIAQATNLGAPYLVRAGILLFVFVLAFWQMKDIGFTPQKSAKPGQAMKNLLKESIHYGLGKPSVRWVMLCSPFVASVSFYVFYAAQPYLLQLYGNKHAYSVAGLAAAITAGAQIIGGMSAGKLSNFFHRRTSALLIAFPLAGLALISLGLIKSFVAALALLCVWGALLAAATPIRQSYLNGLIESKRRATLLSFDSLLGDVGAVPLQPTLGKIADVYSYGASMVVGGAFQLLAIPLLLLSRGQDKIADIIPEEAK